MRKANINQSGFSVIELLLVVLVVAALAVTGLVVYQHHKSTNKNNAATGSTQSTGQSQGTTSTQPASATTQYLTIKELGVKLPLSSAISNAYYVVAKGSSSGAGGQPDKVWLGSHHIPARAVTQQTMTQAGEVQ